MHDSAKQQPTVFILVSIAGVSNVSDISTTTKITTITEELLGSYHYTIKDYTVGFLNIPLHLKSF
jgi:hypothetical protein